MHHDVEGKPRILIVDENPLFVDALTRTIQTIDGSIIFSCSPGDDLESLESRCVDVVVCDPSVGGKFDASYIAVLKGRFPECLLMVLTSDLDQTVVFGAMSYGAQSFVLKSEPIETIRTAVELTCRGGIAFSLSVATQLVSAGIEPVRESPLVSPGWRSLSPREVQVIELVAQGYSDAEIGQRLGISPRTSQQHVRNILGKLDCRSRSEAVARVVGGESRLVRANIAIPIDDQLALRGAGSRP